MGMLNPASAPRLGEYIRDRAYDRICRVTEIHHSCPQSDDWIEQQSVPVTDGERKETWVSALVDGGGSIVTPVSRVTVIPAPKTFENSWCKEYFRDAVPEPQPAQIVYMTNDRCINWDGVRTYTVFDGCGAKVETFKPNVTAEDSRHAMMIAEDWVAKGNASIYA